MLISLQSHRAKLSNRRFVNSWLSFKVFILGLMEDIYRRIWKGNYVILNNFNINYYGTDFNYFANIQILKIYKSQISKFPIMWISYDQIIIINTSMLNTELLPC